MAVLRDRLPAVLTIAGSDSGGGAGIQADLITFAAHGVFGTTAITAITAQNTVGVTRIDPVPVDGLRAQIEAVLDDIPIGAIKLGMLATAAHARCVAEILESIEDRPPIVVDPVMVSTSGARLLDDDAIRVIRNRLLPLAALATPNLAEAAVLASGGDPMDWARVAPCPILITGGDMPGSTVTDILVHRQRMRRWTGLRHALDGDGNVHGTGCTLASAVAARLALGAGLEDAIDGSIHWVRALVAGSVRLGAGARVLVRFPVGDPPPEKQANYAGDEES